MCRPIKLSTFFFLLVASAVLAAKVDAQSTNPFTEREVAFNGAGGFQLRGTLVLPSATKGKVPGVLLLPGSGPSDRNGNQPPQLVTDLLKQIAERLAADGFASLRFDKRAAAVYATTWPKDMAAMNNFFSYDALLEMRARLWTS